MVTAAPPPVGRRLLFVKGNELVTVAPDGSGLRRVPGTAGGFEPRSSPDGTRIAFLVDLGHGAG